MPFRGTTRDPGDATVLARRLQVLFDRLPALIAYWDRDLRNVIANSAYIEWFGLSPEEMQGMHIREVLGEDVYAKNLPFITGALNGEEQLFERTLVDTHGRTRHTQASYVPDIIDGENRGFFVLVTDVTPRVEAQRAMDEAQQIAQLGSWTYDLRTELVTWTDELYRIFGEKPGAFTPTVQGVLDRVHPEDVERVNAAQATARVTGLDYVNHYRVVRPDGTVREVQSRGLTHLVGGEVVRLTGTVQDVTETNEAARELSRVNTELRRVNQLGADVLAMLGHDVRAPLAVMLGFLEELVEHWDSTPDAVRFAHAQRIQHAGRRLQTLIDDILTLATVDAGELAPRTTGVNVRGAVDEALSGVGGADTVQVSVPADLTVAADPFHLRQIVANLITNALRYGDAPITVCAAPGADRTIEIRVRDRGPGVPESQVPSLFQKFVREGAPRSGAVAGAPSGFGLYISSRLASANSGELVYEAEDGGACFRLTLPALSYPA